MAGTNIEVDRTVDLISTVTDSVIEEVIDWQNRRSEPGPFSKQ
jgi:hypothetical protein